MSTWLVLIVGSSVGGVARYVLSGLTQRVLGTGFPHGTLIVNLTGCFLIGILAVLSEEKFLLGPNAKLFLMVGFCGAFTTFSTFIFETSRLMSNGETMHALANVLLSVLLGFILFRLGVFVAEFV